MRDVCSFPCRGHRGGRRNWWAPSGSRFAASVVLGVLLMAGEVSADGLFTGSAGASFANDRSERVGTWGLSLAGMAGGVFGFELDFARTGQAETDSVFVTDSRHTMVTGNVIVGVPLGPVRPYVVGGLGWLRTDLDVSTGGGATDDGLAMDFGGGLMGFFGDHIGARADLRYVRAVSAGEDFLDFQFEKLSFVRFTGGIVLRF